jgi:hypothetical protein
MALGLNGGATLKEVRVFLVGVHDHGPLARMLQALGADVHVFASLGDARAAAIPIGNTVLVVSLSLAEGGPDAASVTLVVDGFGVPGILRPAVSRPTFGDRFVEAHHGQPEPARLCASVVRSAALSGHGLVQLGDRRARRMAS